MPGPKLSLSKRCFKSSEVPDLDDVHLGVGGRELRGVIYLYTTRMKSAEAPKHVLDDAKDDEDSTEELRLPDFVLKSAKTPKKGPSNAVDEKLERMLADMEKEEWYHGCLPLEDIIGLLKNNGDFLIRELEPEGEKMAMVALTQSVDPVKRACVTVKWEDKVHDQPVHYTRLGKDQTFTIDGRNKKSDIMSLVKFHYSSKTPVNGGALLQQPISKQPWELTSDKITMNTKIGSGTFGEVWQGSLSCGRDKPPVVVAIKVKKVCDENKVKLDEMYKEARLMRQYKHKNVVTFYGIVNKSTDIAMIVMEMVNGGALNDYLKKNKDISSKVKIGFAADVAHGLVYLHSKGCMHRDIACRNCLIDVDKNVVKITDFGLSKQAESYKIPDDEPIPIRWQAPEVIATRIYTVKCDVYSYGITIWEVFNNGEIPFTGIDNKTIRSKISDNKFRPPIDFSVPIVVRRVIKTCWRGDPKRRPTMSQAARYLVGAPPELLEPGRPAKTPALDKHVSSKDKVKMNSGESAEGKIL
ncbi:protein tyrosine kinase [Ostertagia ostertagi]